MGDIYLESLKQQYILFYFSSSPGLKNYTLQHNNEDDFLFKFKLT